MVSGREFLNVDVDNACGALIDVDESSGRKDDVVDSLK